MLGLTVLQHYSIPDLSRLIGLPISTVRRRLEWFAECGWVERLGHRQAIAANRARVATGGVQSTRLPVMYGPGPFWLEVAAEVRAVDGGRLAERAGVREGRYLRVHRVTLTCTVSTPPARLERTVSVTPTADNPGGRILAPYLRPLPFGNHGQVKHERTVELDGLVWHVCFWQMPSKPEGGWSTATFTLAKDSAQRVDAGQVAAFAVELYGSAVRAMQYLEGMVACRLQPMHPLDFCERVHAALGVEGPTADFLDRLPANGREWTLADGRRVWGDFSEGAELESGLPSSGAADLMTCLDEGIAWMLRDPEGMTRLVGEVAIVSERFDRLDAALRQFILNAAWVEEPGEAGVVEDESGLSMFG